jgi:alkanesulfonate monooxygenase SsuD/methylene tetrahydromethanopterin reductase-like flavin-dependent oxidoreductase (luciferase family)
MVLGLGAGWQEREHTLFGHNLGDIPTRMARFEEGLEVITRLLNSDEPVTFEGRYFQLRGATLLPRPQRPGGPAILIGGTGPRRTLPLVAKYADIWNGLGLTPDAFRERSSTLDALLQAAGRKPGDVRRTMMLALLFGRDMDELDRQLGRRREAPELANKSLEEAIDMIEARGYALIGTPERIIQRIRFLTSMGIDELMLQWFEMDDIDRLRAFATHVLPRV